MEGTPKSLEDLRKLTKSPAPQSAGRSPASIFNNQKQVVNQMAQGISHAAAPKIPTTASSGLGSLIETYSKNFDDRQAAIDNLKALGEQQQKQMFDPGLSTVDLTPLMSFVDSYTGSKLTSNYKPPETQKEKLNQLGILEKLRQKQEQELADDQLKFTKIVTDSSGDSAQSVRDKLRALSLARQNAAFDYNVLKDEKRSFTQNTKDYLTNMKLSAQMLQALEDPSNNVALQAAVKSLASINQGGRLSDFDVKSALNSPGIQASLEKWLDAKLNNKPVTDIQFDQIKDYAAKLGKFSYDSIKDVENASLSGVTATTVDPESLRTFLQADKAIDATRFPELIHKLAPDLAEGVPNYQKPQKQAAAQAPAPAPTPVAAKPVQAPAKPAAKPAPAIDTQKIKEENLRKFREQQKAKAGKK